LPRGVLGGALEVDQGLAARVGHGVPLTRRRSRGMITRAARESASSCDK
jgi:hypothetical protein